jgi:translation initiation factor eIF-2B subunit delta
MLVHSSSLLQRILLEAHCSGTKFRVIVVDGRPWREGQEMLRRLVQCGLDCSYILVSAASFIMREDCKVKQQPEQGFICYTYNACLVSNSNFYCFNVILMFCFPHYKNICVALMLYECSHGSD